MKPKLPRNWHFHKIGMLYIVVKHLSYTERHSNNLLRVHSWRFVDITYALIIAFKSKCAKSWNFQNIGMSYIIFYFYNLNVCWLLHFLWNFRLVGQKLKKMKSSKKWKHDIFDIIERYNLAKLHVSSTCCCLSLNSNVGTFPS